MSKELNTKTPDGSLTTSKSIEAATNTTPTTMPHVVIVGAGFGGIQAAKALVGQLPTPVALHLAISPMG